MIQATLANTQFSSLLPSQIAVIRQNYDTKTPLQVTCDELHDCVTVLLNEAIQQAVESLDRKGLVKIQFVGPNNPTDTYPNDPDNHEIRSRVLGGKPVDDSSYSKNYFIVGLGGLARKSLTFGADIDFLVFPSDESSIPYTQALQKEIRFTLNKLLKQNDLPFKTDDMMTDLVEYHVPPEQVPDKLLVPERETYDPEFQASWRESTITSRVMRDVEFLCGDKEAYKKFAEIIKPRLYPYDAKGNILNAEGVVLIRELLETPLKEKLEQLKLSLPKAEEDPAGFISKLEYKDDVMRLFHLYTWLTRANEGIENPNYNTVLKTRIVRNSLDPQTADDLSLSHDFFTSVLITLRDIRKKVIPIKKPDNERITTDIQPQIAEKCKLDVHQFRKAFVTYLNSTVRIMSTDLFPEV